MESTGHRWFVTPVLAALAVAGGLLVAAPANAVATGASCSPTWRTLEVLAGQAQIAEDVNRHGVVAGRESGGGPMAIWQPDGSGAFIDLPWAEPQVVDLNNEGQVLGVGFAVSGARRSFVWDAGTFTPLAGTGLRRLGRVAAFNDDGSITGVVRTHAGQRPALWASPTAVPELLPMPKGYQHGEGWSINASGVVTGRVYNLVPGTVSTDAVAIVRWRDGTAHVVDSPQVDHTRNFVHLVAGKYFAGESFDPTGDRWNTTVPMSGSAADYQPLVVDGADYGSTTSLTRTGVVSGQVVFPDDNQIPTAFIAAPGGEPQLMDDYQLISSLHGFDHLTAVFTGGDTLSVGSCLAPLIEE
jgi:hypothetical protein